jgi:hypothetical protein
MNAPAVAAGLTFDGFGINGADEYRSRLATFTESAIRDGRAARFGDLLASAPELAADLAAVRDELHQTRALLGAAERASETRGRAYEELSAALTTAREQRAEARRALANIMRASLSGNNGAVMGEATLSQHFVSLGRAALGDEAAALLGSFHVQPAPTRIRYQCVADCGWCGFLEPDDDSCPVCGGALSAHVVQRPIL